jgi:hypothetical protein
MRRFNVHFVTEIDFVNATQFKRGGAELPEASRGDGPARGPKPHAPDDQGVQVESSTKELNLEPLRLGRDDAFEFVDGLQLCRRSWRPLVGLAIRHEDCVHRHPG